MHRLTIIAAAALACVTGSAHAAGLELQLGWQRVPDPSFGLVSEQPSLSTIGLRVVQPLKPALNLSWTASYEYGARSNYDNASGYDEYGYPDDSQGTVEARLAFHGLEAGVRWTLPGSRVFVPYVGVSARGYIGQLRISDDLTGWYQPDPDDPTGEEALYEVEPTRQIGAGAGVQGTVGLQVWLSRPQKPRPVALAMLTADDISAVAPPPPAPSAAAPAPAPPAAMSSAGTSPSATPSSAAPAPAPAPSAATSSAGTSPSAAPSATPAAEPGATGSAAASGSSAGREPATSSRASGTGAAGASGGSSPEDAVSGSTAAGTERTTTSDVPQPAPIVSAKPARRGPAIGVNFEMGYLHLLSGLRFVDAGVLDLHGLRVQGGVLVVF